jgi:hypothetical protein
MLHQFATSLEQLRVLCGAEITLVIDLAASVHHPGSPTLGNP